MRFFENGPSIPTALLDECAAGRVIFFCGAGVSQYNKGSEMRMPGFIELTKNVIDRVKPQSDSDITKAISDWDEGKPGSVPLDQIFYLLQQDFGKQKVADIVADELRYRSSSQAYPPRHRDILELSKNDRGIPQVVTTNFDILFEKAHSEKDIRINFPPFLPDLSSEAPVAGVTYIHGRINQYSRHLPKEMNLSNDLILSKSDFGRAYLSEGWAAGLVRYLISKYTVVFVGYRAEDPPIQYMLLGMESHSMRSKLYAFEQEKTKSRKDEWEEKGVTLIPYFEHENLWDTISEWARWRKRPLRWQRKKLAVTSKDPKVIKPYQRGQVIYLLRTVEGITDLRKMTPSAKAEWINVFDAAIRKDKDLAVYIDDDSGMKYESPYLLDNDKPVHLIGDESTTVDLLKDRRIESDRSVGISYDSAEDSKSVELTKWICDNLNSPAMAWWFSRKHILHRSLLESMEEKLHSTSQLNWRGRLAWKLILESRVEESFVDPWKRFEAAIGSNGNRWNQSTLREFSNVTMPYISREDKDSTENAFPPEVGWNRVNIHRVANLHVRFPKRPINNNIIPTRKVLLEGIRIFQANLIHATLMIAEIDKLYGRRTYTASSYQTQGDHKYIKNMVFYHEISWFIDIFNRLSKVDPKSATIVANEWPISDSYIFRKIKFFALENQKLFSPSEVYNEIMMLTDENFWCNETGRELLFLIGSRWSTFDEVERQGIAKRIVQDSMNMDNSEVNTNVAEVAALYGRWLQLQGCDLPVEQAESLSKIIESLDDWDDRWAMNSTEIVVLESDLEESIESVGGERDMGGQQVSDVTDSGLQVENSANDSREKLLVLLESDEVGAYPAEYWKSIFGATKDVSDPVYRALMKHLVRLPYGLLQKVNFDFSDHLEKNFERMLTLDPILAWEIFDRFVSTRRPQGVVSKRSIFKRRMGDEERVHGSSCYVHAINNPVGKATLGLIKCIDATNSEISLEVKLRLERLLSEATYGRDQCISILTSNIGFLSHVDSDWVKENLLPLFQFRHEMTESAWGGILYYNRLLEKNIFLNLSVSIANLYPKVIKSFSWKDTDLKGSSFLVVTAGTILSREHKPTNDGYSKMIMRCLLNMDMTSIKYSIFWLRDIGQKADSGWTKFVIPFLESTWPREESFKSPELVWSWMQLLLNSGDEFPEVYSSVKSFLVPIANHSIRLKHFLTRRLGQEPLASKFPAEVLSFIDTIVPNDPNFFIAHLYRVLSMIGSANDELLQDVRYIRLMNIATRRPLTSLS